MTLKLYELTAAYQQLSELEDENFEQALEDLHDLIEVKVDNIVAVVRSLEAEAEAYDTEAKRLTEKAQAARNRASRLKEYLRLNMTLLNLKEVRGTLFKVWRQDNPPACKVEFWEMLPEEYVINPPPPPPQPDKKALIAHWKETGETFPGVEIIVGEHLRIR